MFHKQLTWLALKKLWITFSEASFLNLSAIAWESRRADKSVAQAKAQTIKKLATAVNTIFSFGYTYLNKLTCFLLQNNL